VAAEHTQPFGEVRVIGDHHSTLTGGDVLNRMEAEYGHVSDTAHLPTFIFGSQSMSGIFNDYQPMLFGQRKNFI
jgi:hypothetical protein